MKQIYRTNIVSAHPRHLLAISHVSRNLFRARLIPQLLQCGFQLSCTMSYYLSFRMRFTTGSSVSSFRRYKITSTSTYEQLGRVQQLTGLIGLSIGPAYVRQVSTVSCRTTFIVIQSLTRSFTAAFDELTEASCH